MINNKDEDNEESRQKQEVSQPSTHTKDKKIKPELNIIIAGPAFPFRGGIANFNEALAMALHKAGHNVTIVNFTLQYPSVLFPGKTQYEKSYKNFPFKNIRIINSVNPISWIKAARFINKLSPDLVVFRYWLPFMAPALGSIARLLNKKVKKLAITDNVIPHEKRKGDKALTHYFVNSMNMFVTMAKSVAKDLDQFDKIKARKILYHPVYDIFGDKISLKSARETLELPADAKLLLFFGFIRKYKGLHLLLDAMTDERIKNMDIKLIIAGEFYENPEPYHDFIRNNNLGSNIIERTTFIPSEEVAAYFCAANCIVQPYITATQSGVTQIAYHFERPMIVTNVSGLPEMVPDGKAGYVVNKDKKELADAIVKFFAENKELEFSRFAANEKHKFKWETFCDELLGMVD